MNNTTKKLEQILKKLNTDISKNNFDIQLNEKVIEIIVNIYRESKKQESSKMILLIEQLKIIFGLSDLCENIDNNNYDESYEEFDNNKLKNESNNIEIITGVFLENLKEYNNKNSA